MGEAAEDLIESSEICDLGFDSEVYTEFDEEMNNYPELHSDD